MARAAVIGAGSWGTALAQLLALKGHAVNLWARKDEIVNAINSNHKNPVYLKDSELDERIIASSSIEEVLHEVDFCLIVTPSQYLRETCESMKPYVANDLPLVICSKGVEHDTGLLASEVVFDVLGNNGRIAVLSGPTHAEEVIKCLPSAATCACENMETANKLRDEISTENFRIYTASDVRGVELCASFKNVIAIAVGVSYGLGFGDNTAALLITRGIAEMSRMVQACGGQMQTCQSLAGVGDMVVTCMSRHSRNRVFGEDYLSQSKTLDEFKADTQMVVEGAVAAKNLQTLSARFNVELPITNAINDMIWHGACVAETAKLLAERPLKEEF